MPLDPELKTGENTWSKYNPENFMASPGCDVILVNTEGRSTTVERLALVLGRLMAIDPNRRVEFWIKLID